MGEDFDEEVSTDKKAEEDQEDIELLETTDLEQLEIIAEELYRDSQNQG